MVAVSELVFGLDAELVRLGYKASTMAWYRGCWRRLQRFFASLGLSTTEIYARASTKAKRTALEAAYTDIVTTDLPEWNQNSELLNRLAGL